MEPGADLGLGRGDVVTTASHRPPRTGDLVVVEHDCFFEGSENAGVRHVIALPIDKVTRLSMYGFYRLSTTRCDGTQLDTVFDPDTNTDEAGHPVRVVAAEDRLDR